nr:MAG TPA: hypothetical protein [Caudoviricetes sp.]
MKACGYGVLLSKKQHLSNQVLFSYIYFFEKELSL